MSIFTLRVDTLNTSHLITLIPLLSWTYRDFASHSPQSLRKLKQFSFLVSLKWTARNRLAQKKLRKILSPFWRLLSSWFIRLSKKNYVRIYYFLIFFFPFQLSTCSISSSDFVFRFLSFPSDFIGYIYSPKYGSKFSHWLLLKYFLKYFLGLIWLMTTREILF